MSCDESQTIDLFEKITDSDSLLNKLCDIPSHKLKSDEIQYNIQYVSCLCQLTKPEKLKITKTQKSSTQKKLIVDRKLEKYANLEPAKKKIKIEKVASKYKNMDIEKKKVPKNTSQ